MRGKQEQSGGQGSVNLQAGRDIHLHVESAPERQATELRGLQGPFPHCDDTMIGRSAELEILRISLESATIVTIGGPSGVGKSRLVSEYARHTTGHKYVSAIWIDSSDPSSIESELTNRYAAESVTELLQRNTHLGRFLVVFDDAPSINQIMHILPTANLADVIITTTRTRNVTFRVEPLRAEQEVISWITSRLQCTAIDAVELVTEVEGLPLSLRQAVAYIATRGTTVSEYLKVASTSPSQSFEEFSPIDYPGGLARSMDRVYTRIAALPGALRIAQALALCDPPMLPASVLDALDLDDNTSSVHSLVSLYVLEPKEGTLGLHRLVQKYLNSRMTDHERSKSVEVLAEKLHTLVHSRTPEINWLAISRQIMSLPLTPSLHCVYEAIFNSARRNLSLVTAEAAGDRLLVLFDFMIDNFRDHVDLKYLSDRGVISNKLFHVKHELRRGEIASRFALREIARASELGSVHERAHLLYDYSMTFSDGSLRLQLLLDAQLGMRIGESFCTELANFYAALLLSAANHMEKNITGASDGGLSNVSEAAEMAYQWLCDHESLTVGKSTIAQLKQRWESLRQIETSAVGPEQGSKEALIAASARPSSAISVAVQRLLSYVENYASATVTGPPEATEAYLLSRIDEIEGLIPPPGHQIGRMSHYRGVRLLADMKLMAAGLLAELRRSEAALSLVEEAVRDYEQINGLHSEQVLSAVCQGISVTVLLGDLDRCNSLTKTALGIAVSIKEDFNFLIELASILDLVDGRNTWPQKLHGLLENFETKDNLPSVASGVVDWMREHPGLINWIGFAIAPLLEIVDVYAAPPDRLDRSKVRRAVRTCLAENRLLARHISLWLHLAAHQFELPTPESLWLHRMSISVARWRGISDQRGLADYCYAHALLYNGQLPGARRRFELAVELMSPFGSLFGDSIAHAREHLEADDLKVE